MKAHHFAWALGIVAAGEAVAIVWLLRRGRAAMAAIARRDEVIRGCVSGGNVPPPGVRFDSNLEVTNQTFVAGGNRESEPPIKFNTFVAGQGAPLF